LGFAIRLREFSFEAFCPLAARLLEFAVKGRMMDDYAKNSE